MMAKKKQESNEPVISNIPIPTSDNPMVIDLPDGQKIVLGKLSAGTVIEVATWRGTGRPDSSTAAQAAAPHASAPAKGKFTLPWKREKMTSAAEKTESSNFITRFIGGTVGSFSKALKRTQDLTPVESTTDLEINAWLENLTREVKEEAKTPTPRKAAVKKAPVKKKTTTATKKKSK